MNYSYIIKNKKIYELEGEKISYDKFGHLISMLIKNRNIKDMMSHSFKRKINWLEKNHPELLI